MVAFGSRLFVTACLLGCAHLVAQSSIRSSNAQGWRNFDSLWNEQTDNVWVAAGYGVTLVGKANGSMQTRGAYAPEAPVLPPGVHYVGASCSHGPRVLRRSDGQLFVSGNLSGGVGLQNVPALPPGVVYTAVAAAHRYILAVRSNGTIVGWGFASGGLPDIPGTIPALPAGVQYVDVGASPRFNAAAAFALRSDGKIVTWGTATRAPALPAGTTYTGLRVGYYHATALRSDGKLVCWGDNTWGQCNVPALPPGVQYVQAAPAEGHTLARRSDGVVVAFGDNTDGQCNVPVLPAGVSYVDIAAVGGGVINWVDGQHSVALRSDGRVVAWGDNTFLQCNVPALPAGVDYVEVAESGYGVFARLSDGNVRAFGLDEFGECDVPPLPSGVTYVEVDKRIARRSDGQVVAWGYDPTLLAVPPLPAGTTYVEVAASENHALARRSDGQVVAWGQGSHGQCLVPALPPNTTYVQIAAGGNNSIAIRSDGAVVAWGDNSHGQCQVPWQLAARRCVEIACGGAMVARCSDGDLMMWGVPPGSGLGVPGLPFGVSYVGISTSMARRSDGLLVSLVGYGVLSQPPAGRSCMEVADTIVREGPTSTYVSFAPGCSGSRPATRLVPIDTPRLGADLEVTLFDLPLDLAIVGTGLGTTGSGPWSLPLSLGSFGMPGCTLFVAWDHTVMVGGAQHEAMLRWTIPNAITLLGARFHQQALVPDPGAGNAMQAVMSAATTAVIGR